MLTCPNSSTTTIFTSEVPKGFYGQLEHGQVPNWLPPMQLPKDSPYQDVESGRLAGEDVREALLQPVDDELGGERGEDHAEDSGDHRFDLARRSAASADRQQAG